MSEINKAEVIKKIEQQINSHPVVLYMKGTADMPRCGFSNKVVQILNKHKVAFTTVDILEELEVREVIKEHSNWPTFPQLYVNGELVGGCDIITEMDESGELDELFKSIN